MTDIIRYQVFVRDGISGSVRVTYNVDTFEDATKYANEEINRIKENHLVQYVTINKIVESEVIRYMI